MLAQCPLLHVLTMPINEGQRARKKNKGRMNEGGQAGGPCDLEPAATAPPRRDRQRHACVLRVGASRWCPRGMSA